MTTPKMTREGLREIGEEVRRSMGHAVAPDGSIPTSPEMGTYSTEAIFALVWGRPGLDRRYRMLATLAVLTALRELVELRIYINTALNGLLTPLEIQEAVVHCSLYAGQPAVVNATAAMRKVFEERGVAVEQPVRPYVSLEELERRGRATRERLLGRRARAERSTTRSRACASFCGAIPLVRSFTGPASIPSREWCARWPRSRRCGPIRRSRSTPRSTPAPDSPGKRWPR